MIFISKQELNNILRGTVSSNTNTTSMWGPLQLFNGSDNHARKTMKDKSLYYTQVLSGGSSIDIVKYSSNSAYIISSVESLESTYPSLKKMGGMIIDNNSCILNIDQGDSLIPGSVLAATAHDISTSTNANVTSTDKNKVGYLTYNDNDYGYIFYELGLLYAYGELGDTIGNWLSEPSSNEIRYSNRLKQNSHIYTCELDTQKNWVSSNNSYWTSIDITNDSVTSSLTSYWNEFGLNSLTISANANNWLIIEKQEYPIYVTTVGLYDDDGDILATGKLIKPQPVYKNFSTNFVVKLRF